MATQKKQTPAVSNCFCPVMVISDNASAWVPLAWSLLHSSPSFISPLTLIYGVRKRLFERVADKTRSYLILSLLLRIGLENLYANIFIDPINLFLDIRYSTGTETLCPFKLVCNSAYTQRPLSQCSGRTALMLLVCKSPDSQNPDPQLKLRGPWSVLHCENIGLLYQSALSGFVQHRLIWNISGRYTCSSFIQRCNRGPLASWEWVRLGEWQPQKIKTQWKPSTSRSTWPSHALVRFGIT